MGLIKAAFGAAGGVMADQWKEFFVCESLPNDVLVRKGTKKTTGRSSNYKGDENIITSGSGIVASCGFSYFCVFRKSCAFYSDVHICF